MATSAFLTSVAAAPQLNFPFNSQLPPVAHWGEAYTYTISSDTYQSSDGNGVTYQASNSPSWLTFSGRTLSGTPENGNGDTTISFTLDASDSTGTSSSNCVSQLTNTQAPSYDPQELFKTLDASGQVANSNSFVLVPNKPFEIDFPSNFFTIPDSQEVLGHYAVTTDHSPSPIWSNFDGASGKFWGTAPSVNSQIAQAQQFSISYMVSTFSGFESAAAQFNLSLGANVLAMNISSMNFDATTNHYFSYNIPLSEIKSNDEPITSANISNVQASIPSDAQDWLKWDKDNFTLSGTPPESAANSNVTVNIELTDTYNDAVSWNIGLKVSSENNHTVFSTSSLPAVNATRGQWFTYDLSNYILNKDVDLSIDSGVSWLQMHNENWTINGQVPYSFTSAMVNITATKKDSDDSKNKRATNDDGSQTDDGMTAHIQLTGVGPTHSSSSSMQSSSTRTSSSQTSSSSVTTSSSQSSTTSTGTNTASTSSATSTASGSALPLAKNQNKSSNNKAVAIGCGVGISLGVVSIAAIILLLCCCRRRRRQQAAAAAAAAGGNGGSGKNAGGTVYAKNGGDPHDSQIDANEDSNISNPRPSSKGIAMAPVFRTTSSDQDSFEDALEYPDDDAGDDGTVISTPEKEAKSRAVEDDEDWNSPQRASTLNFLAMNGTDDSSECTLPVPNESEEMYGYNGTAVPLNTGMGPNEVPPSREEDDVVADMPRESWRHTNTGERRWQEQRMSHSSLASIVPTEPPTVQLASQEFSQGQQVQPSTSMPKLAASASQNSFYTPNTYHTPSVAPEPAMQREYSSGVIHRVGSHSSSHYSEPIRHSRAVSQHIDGHYRTDSSESQNSNELSDDSSGANFRPYRDEHGNLHWREENPTSHARLRDNMLDRKPSAAKTPRGDTGEFVFV